MDLLIDSKEFMSHRYPNHMKMMRLTQAVKRLQAKLDIFESSLPPRDRGPLPNPPADDFLTEFLTDIDSNMNEPFPLHRDGITSLHPASRLLVGLNS
jgi:hypothetical protein